MVLRLPQWLTNMSARLGDAVPASPWCSETLAMLGSDNVGNAAVFERLLGRLACITASWLPPLGVDGRQAHTKNSSQIRPLSLTGKALEAIKQIAN